MKARRQILPLLIAGIAAPAPAAAQELLPVNLYVANIDDAGGLVRIGQPQKLTGDRGVSSQPAFTPDGKSVLFIGRRDSANAQSDVYRIDLGSGAETRVTTTPENENSPTVTHDGHLMVIRWVPATLFTEWGPWLYDMRGNPVRGVLPGPDTVGYYVQVDSTTFAMVRPRSPSHVAIFDTRSGSMTDRDAPVANLPPQLIPGQRAVSYTLTDSLGRNVIRKLDIASGSITTIGPAVLSRVAHAWTPRGVLLMGKGNRILAMTPGRDTVWRQVAAFEDPELQNITTYVVSPKGDKVILISPVKPPLHTLIRDAIQSGSNVAEALATYRDAPQETVLKKYDVDRGGLRALTAEVQRRSTDDAAAIETLTMRLLGPEAPRQ